MLSDRCPVCDSVTLAYCGQTVGRTKIKLGLQVGLGPGHIVETQLPIPQRGTARPQFSAHICYGQMAAWIKMPLGIAVGFDPGDFVRWGPSPHPPKKGVEPLPNFLLWSNGWMDQDATWYGGIGLGPGTLCSMGTQLAKNKCSAVAEMGDRLATRHGPKMGGCTPFRNFNKNSSGDEIANVNFITTTSHM